MKKFLLNAFSIIELLITLSLVTLLYCFSISNFKVKLKDNQPEKQLYYILTKCRQLSINRNETIFLKQCENNYLSIFDKYGNALAKEKYPFQIIIYDTKNTKFEEIKIFPSGFSKEYITQIGHEKYSINPLSLYVQKIKQ